MDYIIVNNLHDLHRAIKAGKVAVCEDGNLIANCDLLDAVAEASSSITDAARFAITALENHKHLILVNSEIDLCFGPYLAHLARKNGVVFTSCDGDQYGVIKHLIDEIHLWGFELVMAGNIKGFLDRYSDPTKIIPEAEKRHYDYKMCTSYTDGTKLGIEMSLVANAYNLRAAVPGMYGPRAIHVSEVFQVFDFEKIRKEQQPVVDYLLGAEPGGGVFVIGYCDDPFQRETLITYKMGTGPYYVFYRPYHLCHLESMSTIANAVLNHQDLLQPYYGIKTNVYAYAKQQLRQGEVLDGIGGYSCYGLIENLSDNLEAPGSPDLFGGKCETKKGYSQG